MGQTWSDITGRRGSKRQRKALTYEPPASAPAGTTIATAATVTMPSSPSPPPAPASAPPPPSQRPSIVDPSSTPATSLPPPPPPSSSSLTALPASGRASLVNSNASSRGSSPRSPAPPTSTAARLFAAARPSLEPTPTPTPGAEEAPARSQDDDDLPMPIPDVPMERCNVTRHLRPSFVRTNSRRVDDALAIAVAPPPRSSGSRVSSSSSSSSNSSASAASGSSLGLFDDDDAAGNALGGGIGGRRSRASSSSSSDYDELVDDDEAIEVNDWLAEPEDAVLTPKSLTDGPGPARPRPRGHSFSSNASSSTQSSQQRGGGLGGRHSLSLTGVPKALTSTSASSGTPTPHNASWFSSPEDLEDEPEDDEEFPPQLSEFIRENMPVYEIMRQVQLFRNLSMNQQEQVLRALKPAKFQDQEVIVQQGTRGSRFYMIAKGEAVITKQIDGEETERMVTHLHPGHYFGELALIYDDPRTATVRAVGDVELLYLTQEDFQRIGQVHLSLMLQQVPLLARLNARDQDVVLSRLKPANFSDGEYIVRQGEEGTRFYMITRGEAVVTEKDTRPDAAPGSERELTRLYEGHVFGEMSLIYSEPRTASVRAVGPVKCLYLSKADFDKCLLSERFQRFIQESYVEKAKVRAMRLRLQQRASTTPVPAKDSSLQKSGDSVSPPPAPVKKTTETKKLVKQRLKNGQKVVNKYVIQGDLGKGTFGRVKLCKNEDDGQLYAVKILQKTFVQRMAGKEDQLQDVLRREVAIMKKLNHRNVVKLVEVIDDPSSQKMYLVQEYVQHNLMDEVTRSHHLSEEIARKYTRDLLSGLHYLHSHKVIHRDIKPENILVSADGVAKMADFGTARMIMNETEAISGAKGTPAFMAPEMFDVDATYTGPSVDIWSLGATLYMMVIGRPPWLADNEIVLAERVQHDELTFPADRERAMDPHLKNLMQRMLTKSPKLRITLSECFNHEWITKEGSEPLVTATEKDLTVSVDESERAIRNIPERIDLSLAEYLEQAHRLVKTRQQSVPRTNSGQSWVQGISSVSATSLADARGTMTPSSASTSSSSPSRTSVEETSRVIRAWRHHKRVHLMYGHKELSDRARELLLEQKRIAFSADRAKVTEIILPAVGPSGSSSTTGARGRFPSTSALQTQVPPPAPSAAPERHMSSPNVLTTGTDAGSSEADPDGFARTSFTSVSDLVHSESDKTSTTEGSRQDDADADLMKRSLSRKKDFLMVTSEVFRDEGGGFQSRKILFQARDHDFSVASRVPTHSTSGRDLGRNSSSQMRRGSRRSMASSSQMSAGSLSSTASGIISTTSRDVDAVSELDLEGLDCVQVADEEDESKGDDSDSDSAASDYSDVECDVDVDDTFNDLIGTPNSIDLVADDDEIAPLNPLINQLQELAEAGMVDDTLADGLVEDVVQVYVSSKIRENLALGIRSGYAEAKGSRSYMEDKSTGIADYVPGPDCVSDLASTYASVGYFAVYDGHNGDETSKFLQKEFHQRLLAYPGFLTDPATAISEVCDLVDLEILEYQNNSMPSKRKLTGEADDDDAVSPLTSPTGLVSTRTGRNSSREDENKAALQPISFSGSAAVLAVVAKRKKTASNTNAQPSSDKSSTTDEDTMLYVANVGDCRAVLCTANGLAVDLTHDHKAAHDEERKRIEASGGFVHNGRLDGILALSRGFGDLAHKTDGHLIVTPDVVTRVIAPSDEFVLLASDGLFDVLSSQQAINFIHRKLRSHGDVQLAAQEMVLKAQQYFAHDNISVIVVALNQVASAV